MIGVVENIVVQSRNSFVEEFFALLEGPAFADLGRMRGVFMNFIDERIGKIDVKRFRKCFELTGRTQDLKTGDDRNVDARRTAGVDVAEVLFVVEEHLGHDVLGSRIDLFLKVLDVDFERGGLEMFFGVPGNADAVVERLRALEVFEEFAALHVTDLLNEVAGVLIFGAVFSRGFLIVRGIAAQGEGVVNAQKVHLDERVFGLFAREAQTENVRDGVDAKAILDDAANAERARALAKCFALDRAVMLFAVMRARRVRGDVDPRRLKRLQFFDDVDDVFNAAAPGRRNDFVAVKGATGFGEMFGHVHGAKLMQKTFGGKVSGGLNLASALEFML